MKENLDFQRIQTAWTRYVAGPESVPEQIPGVRPEIVDSWRRSKGQADPFALEKTIPSDHLQALVQDNAQLIRIARPYLMNLFQYLRETKHQITIVDAHGWSRLVGWNLPGPGDPGPDQQWNHARRGRVRYQRNFPLSFSGKTSDGLRSRALSAAFPQQHLLCSSHPRSVPSSDRVRGYLRSSGQLSSLRSNYAGVSHQQH